MGTATFLNPSAPGTTIAQLVGGKVPASQLPPASGSGVTSVNGYTTSVVSLVKGDIGLGNVDNTPDVSKPVSTAQAAAITAALSAAAGTTVASLVGGVIPTSQIPAIALVNVQVVASTAAMLALSTQPGDVVVVNSPGGVSTSYMRNNGVTGTLSDFTVISTPSGASSGVTSVNGQTSATVVLGKADIGLPNVDNTADVAKSVLSASKLTTARTIGGVPFDGTANVALTSAALTDFAAAADARVAAAAGTSVASLVGGVIPTAQIPAVALVTVQAANSQAAMLALPTQQGDVVRRTDLVPNVTYMRGPGVVGDMTDWVIIDSGTGAVSTVNGQNGTVVLAKADVGLGSVDNTPDASKSVQSAGKLTTARAINGQSFDGTAAVTIPATAVPSTPAGAVASTNVQAAITELDTKKAALAGATFTGPLSVPTPTAALHAATKAYVDAIMTQIFPNYGTQPMRFVGFGNAIPTTGQTGDVYLKTA